jgi:polar amino acid transport system substrate-binding protein
MLLRVLLALAIAFALTACQGAGGGGSGAPAADGRLQQILDGGVLRVAVSADRPPLNAKNGRGEVIGFEADIVRALADAMSLELRFVVVPFAELIPSLLRGDADIAISGLTMTPERNARVAFAGPYYVSGMGVLARSREISRATRPEALDVAARRYAAVEASTSAKFIGDALPHAQLVSVPDYAAGVQKVLAGEVDALFADHLVCNLAVWRHPEAGLSSMETPLTIEPLGIAVPPDAPLLLNLVENHLETLDHAGLLSSFKAKWLADGRWLGELD